MSTAAIVLQFVGAAAILFAILAGFVRLAGRWLKPGDMP